MRAPGKNPRPGGRETRAGEREAGHRRGQQESRLEPSSEHQGRAGSAPRAKCRVGPGLAKPLLLQPSLPLPAAAPTAHGSSQGPARRGGPRAPRPVLGGSEAQRGRPELRGPQVYGCPQRPLAATAARVSG